MTTRPGYGHVPLSPTTFLERAAAVFAARVAVVDDTSTFTYADLYDRCRRLAGALSASGVGPGDRVAALCTNSHVMLELHNAVPLARSVLVPLNFRLAPDDLRRIIDHSGARLLIATAELADLAADLAARTGVRIAVDTGAGGDYERLVGGGSPLDPSEGDEDDLLAINYTSGSTGTPKGVMYTHRGAYLQAVAMAYHCRLGTESDYLWTLPMFHCDGWCLTWAVTAAGGVHRCLRSFDAGAVWRRLQHGEVTHLSGAPTVLTMIAQAAEELGGPPPDRTVHTTTGGAPPTPALLARLEPLNLSVTHLYGLTETYGPAVVNVWQPEWSGRPAAERARLNARQGVGNVTTAGLRVVDPGGHTVPADGATIGEIVVRGNNVMAGYYRDPVATAEAFIDGWLRTGDLGVCHPDGYVELRDRAKDIIVTGGENVASVEVEAIICELPEVLEVAVVAVPDELWGEVPVAVVTLRGSASITADAVIAHVRSRTAHFKAPRQVFFFELPKTSTGKVQKHELRRRLAGPPADTA